MVFWYERGILVMILVCFLLFHYFVFWKFTFNYEDFASSPSTIFDKLTKSEEHLIFKDLGEENINAPEENLLWFIHLSDIHISHYEIGKGKENFERFLRYSLPCIKPLFVVATGDLTESARNILDSQQIEQEWQVYRSLLEKYHALDKKDFWIDIRGNHDAFDVPDLNHSNNYFAKYSQTKEYNFTRSFQKDNTKVSLVAFDACPTVGFNRFFNFVGYIEEPVLETLSNNIRNVSDSQIVVGIGHYPLSILQVPNQFPLKQVTGNISIYLCGHLHRVAGEELRTVHSNGMGEFEIPDLKNAGIFRLISVDHGLVNFRDVNVCQDHYIMITNPKNAKYYVARENKQFIHNSANIRILVFSKSPTNEATLQVKVFIDDTEFGNVIQSSSDSKLWLCSWNPKSISGGLHKITATLIETRTNGGNSVVATDSFQFSVDETAAPLAWNILHAPFGLWFKSIAFGIQLFLLISFILCLFMPLKFMKINFQLPFQLSNLRYHKQIVYISFGYVVSHLIFPFHVGRFVPSSPIVYLHFFFGVFDLSGNFYPVLDTYIWYVVHMTTIYIPALRLTCKMLSPHSCKLHTPLNICWLIYCLGYFCFDFYHTSYHSLLLSTRFIVLCYYLGYYCHYKFSTPVAKGPEKLKEKTS